jgi:hypothetical protein
VIGRIVDRPMLRVRPAIPPTSFKGPLAKSATITGAKTVLVADARQPVQDFLERLLAEHGYGVTGPEPDLVLTPDAGTARF